MTPEIVGTIEVALDKIARRAARELCTADYWAGEWAQPRLLRSIIRQEAEELGSYVNKMMPEGEGYRKIIAEAMTEIAEAIVKAYPGKIEQKRELPLVSYKIRQVANAIGKNVYQHLPQVNADVINKALRDDDDYPIQGLLDNPAWSEEGRLKKLRAALGSMDTVREEDGIHATNVFLGICAKRGMLDKGQKDKLFQRAMNGKGEIREMSVCMLAVVPEVDQMALYKAAGDDLALVQEMFVVWGDAVVDEVRLDVAQRVLATKRGEGGQRQAHLFIDLLEWMVKNMGRENIVMQDPKTAQGIVTVLVRQLAGGKGGVRVGAYGAKVAQSICCQMLPLSLEDGDWTAGGWKEGKEQKVIGKVFSMLSSVEKAKVLSGAGPDLRTILFGYIAKGGVVAAQRRAR